MRFRSIAFIVAGAVILLVAGAAWVAAPSVRYQLILGSSLERDLGFRHGTPYVRCGASFDEVLTFEQVTPGGVCDRAGVREGDVVLDLSVTELFRLLHERRGAEATVTVVAGGAGPALGERAERRVVIAVPERK